jgi:hypothetical protein
MPQDTMDIQTKSFGGFQLKDESTGEVEAIVGNIGVVDLDGDVILPGAIAPGNRVQFSSWEHDLVIQKAAPAGIGTMVEEDGNVVLRGRFFTTTERGREALATVKELGEDGRWSFGFPNRTAKTARLTPELKALGARRALSYIDPMEVSPVFRPAGLMTRTVSIKSADLKAESLNDRIEAVHNALWNRNETAGQPWYAHEVFDDYMIVRSGGKLLQVPYTVGDEGAVTLGDATEVEVEYVPVKADETKSAEEEIETAGPPAEEEADAKADAEAATEVEEVEDPTPEPEAVVKSAEEAEEEAIAHEVARFADLSEFAQAMERKARAEEELRLATAQLVEVKAQRDAETELERALELELSKFQRTRRRLGVA